MKVLQITSAHESSDAEACLAAAGLTPLGACTMRARPRRRHHLLVRDGGLSIEALHRHGITAVAMDPPPPVTTSAVVWWKNWREALGPQVYFDFRQQHHEEIRSIGSMVRVRQSDSGVEPWHLLGDAGVDIRCEFQCVLPTGLEFQLLVTDGDKAIRVLKKAGIPATHMDYRGPVLDQGISWWGEWKPALAYAGQVQRPILMSFASPRVEQVPGIW
jgi:hypothetical protein